MLREDDTFVRFQIIIEDDLTSSALHLVNILEVNCDYLQNMTKDCNICESYLFSCQLYDDSLPGRSRHHDSTSTFYFSASCSIPIAKVILPDIGDTYHLLSCPASGRLLILFDLDGNHKLVEFESYGCWGRSRTVVIIRFHYRYRKKNSCLFCQSRPKVYHQLNQYIRVTLIMFRGKLLVCWATHWFILMFIILTFTFKMQFRLYILLLFSHIFHCGSVPLALHQ
jgi:hypothetical protein